MGWQTLISRLPRLRRAVALPADLPRPARKGGRLEAAAATLGMSVDQLEATIIHNASTKVFPKRFTKYHLLRDIDIARTEAFHDGSSSLELANGRVFWGPRESQREALCRLLRSSLPKEVVPGAYGLAIEVNIRYNRSFRYSSFPTSGVVIEAGAKRGYQAVGFAEHLGPSSRVLAIELAGADYAYMARTFAANPGIAELIPVHGALSSEDGRTVGYGGTVHTISQGLEGVENTGENLVQTVSLKTLLEKHNIDRVDFLNIMVNGEELKVLQGLGNRLSDVRLIRIASYYSDAHGDMASQCVRYVSAMGGTVISSNFPGSTYLRVSR